MRIPIVVVAYNRIHCLERLLTSLNKANYPTEDVELIISIDRGDNQNVLAFAEAFDWKHGTKSVRYQPRNLGLKKHILQCGDLSQAYDAIIMLEDDLYVSPDFYGYALAACAFAAEDDRIGGVALYNHRICQQSMKVFEPVCDGYDNWYFQFAASWGQLWTKNQWAGFKEWFLAHEDYDFSGSEKIPAHIKDWGKNSWLKYNIAYVIETNRYFLYPRTAYSTNFSDAGVNHNVNNTVYQVPLMRSLRPLEYHFSTLEESGAVYDAWFENQKLEAALGADGVCIDLYGEKTWFENKPYLLTSSRMTGAEVVRTFGREMRPQDMNILENIPGDRLTLYRLGADARKAEDGNGDKEEELTYFFRGFIYRYKKTAARMFLSETTQKIRKRLHRNK